MRNVAISKTGVVTKHSTRIQSDINNPIQISRTSRCDMVSGAGDGAGAVPRGIESVGTSSLHAQYHILNNHSPKNNPICTAGVVTNQLTSIHSDLVNELRA